MADVIDFGSPYPAEVTQTDVENILCFTNRSIEDATRVDLFGGRMLDRLAQGADVEVGTHCVEREVETNRGVREERLVVNGSCVYRRRHGSASKLKRRH